VGSAALLVRLCAKILGGLLIVCRNVGLFRYWTLSNLPLFLLAMPCLMVLLTSSVWASRYSISSTSPVSKDRQARTAFDRESLIRLAIPQVFLALAAFTTYHVQVINRLSSGYPLWYIWLASMIAAPTEEAQVDLVKRRRTAKLMVKSVAVYAIVQGGLFASFLPPA
jgi:GPI mannosyltransferase 2